MKKYKVRKTGEIVEVVAWTGGNPERSPHLDFVSYIDSSGEEHYKEPMNYIWDLEPLDEKAQQSIDWEQRRYEIARVMLPVIVDKIYENHYKYDNFVRSSTEIAIQYANTLINGLKSI